jgi:hypothetical protein
MYNNDDYPLGADTAEAPWNALIPSKRKFEVSASQTLSKNTNVITTNYYMEYNEWENEWEYDTSGVDWTREYFGNGHYKPSQLIHLFKNHLENELRRFGDTIDKKRYLHLIEECKGWIEDDYVVCQS